MARVTPVVALIGACGFEHFLGFLLDFEQRLHIFVEQKRVLRRSACHQPVWGGTSQPVRGGRKWHFFLKFSVNEESQTPHKLITL